MRRAILVAILLAAGAVAAGGAEHPGGSGGLILKEENFDKDPGWDGYNNRLKPDAKEIRTVVQDFGYNQTNFAGGQKGEMGGQVWRCTTPAFYADRIPVKTLNDKLTASGKFAFTSAQGGAGIWFGWFHAQQEAGNVRPMGGLGLNFDFQGDGGRLAIRMSNEKNRFCGTFVTPYIPGKFRPTALSPSTQYVWTLSYDPAGNEGNGRIQFTIKSVGMGPEADEYADMQAAAANLPADMRAQFEGQKVGRPDFDGGKPFIVDLPPGFKQEGASFDRFGLMNTVKEGDAVKIYFDDLQYDGKSEDFSTDPQWEGVGNRARLQENLPTGIHDFGFSAATHFAGGAPGEMTGIFWRLTKAYGYYADRIGPVTFDDPLEASGKLMLKLGTPDSEMAFGWFNSSQREIPKEHVKQEGHLDKTDNFLGVYLAGPSRLGRCMLPSVVTSKGSKVVFKEPDQSPRPAPGQIYDWTMKYDPKAESGKGALTVTLGKESATLILDEKLRAEGATFDRFGFFPSGGGGQVQISFDNLKYTARRQ